MTKIVYLSENVLFGCENGVYTRFIRLLVVVGHASENQLSPRFRVQRGKSSRRGRVGEAIHYAYSFVHTNEFPTSTFVTFSFSSSAFNL